MPSHAMPSHPMPSHVTISFYLFQRINHEVLHDLVLFGGNRRFTSHWNISEQAEMLPYEMRLHFLLFCLSIHFSVLTRIRLCKHLSQNQHLVSWIFNFSNLKLTTLSVFGLFFIYDNLWYNKFYLNACFLYTKF
jgi:ABC-type proline/glycine betaine transport system permease subunit